MKKSSNAKLWLRGVRFPVMQSMLALCSISAGAAIPAAATKSPSEKTSSNNKYFKVENFLHQSKSIAGTTNSISPPAAVERTITGKVRGDKNEELPGVSIVLKGTQKGTTTDVSGNYSIVLGDEPNPVLIFSFVGSASQEVVVGSKTVIDVVLISDAKALNEVVVVGYGTQKKKDLTGAVAIVNVAEMQQQPTSQITSQLQGRASGVTVLGSGQPGEAPQIRIRGINTFGNNAPLYVVDGVPTQNINDINPNDVASMQVLKDAGSASIYGSRAANGVIILTTKRGSGKIKVQYDAYAGTQRPQSGNVWNLLNPQETAQLKFNALKNVNPNDRFLILCMEVGRHRFCRITLHRRA